MLQLKDLAVDHQEILDKLTPVERLDMLFTAMDKKKCAPYASDSYKFSSSYAVGDRVIVLSEMYYIGKITQRRDDFVCPELKKLIPTYRVKYDGWRIYDELDRQWVAEYDIFGVSHHKKTTEHLLAHYYNQHKLYASQLRLSLSLDGQRSRGLFKLSAEEEAAHLAVWNASLSAALLDVTAPTFKELFAIA